MSPLTRIFVVLLVVCSMLLTASVVVFVSKTENVQASLEKAQGQLEAANLAATRAQTELASARTSAETARLTAEGQIKALQQELADKQAQISTLGVQIADLSSKNTLASADVNRLTEALKTAQDTTAKLQDHVTELRKASDDLVRQRGELNVAISDLQNRLDVTERERRNVAEQLTEANAQIAQMRGALADANITLQPRQTTGLSGGAPDIKGVVRATRSIAGIPYATISVGSADDVQKGMEFNLIDRERGEFLGKLYVDTVEPNEATGRLDGPRINEVRQGTEVRTQLN